MRRPRVLPYELFLHITEYIILGAAETCTAPDRWHMCYRVDGLKDNNQIIDLHTTSKKAEGNQINGERNNSEQASGQGKGRHDSSTQDKGKHDSPAHKGEWAPCEARFYLYSNHDTGVQRYQATRLTSQINRQTRAMTHRKFLRLPVEGLSVEAWLLMEIDEFTPTLQCSDKIGIPFPFASSLALRDIMLQPTPGLKTIFDKIRSVHIESVELFQEANREDIEAILALKSLDQISIQIGEVDEDCIYLAHKNGVIDWYFPDLLQWEVDHGASFPRLWKPFGDRNIALVAEDKQGGYWMQLLDTPDGIRVVFPWDGNLMEEDDPESNGLEDDDSEEY